ncbi:MAG: hypothetical protein RLZZ336_1378, partial [Cyanobacteriota bacterium]
MGKQSYFGGSYGPIPFLAQDILIILLLIVANGLFSGAEIAIISARRHRL